jgi:hypothetical protein
MLYVITIIEWEWDFNSFINNDLQSVYHSHSMVPGGFEVMS